MRSTDETTVVSSVGNPHYIHDDVGSTDQYACREQPTLPAEPLFVFLSEEEKRRFYLNRIKPLRSPQNHTESFSSTWFIQNLSRVRKKSSN